MIATPLTIALSLIVLGTATSLVGVSSGLFSIHVIGMTAFVCLFCIGTAVKANRSAGANSRDVHAQIMWVGVIALIAGAAAIWTSKDRQGKPHFTSPQ